MANLVPIGRVSKVSHLSVEALRHYDALGLLRPALEMPLEEIRAVLRARDAAGRLGLGRQVSAVACTMGM